MAILELRYNAHSIRKSWHTHSFLSYLLSPTAITIFSSNPVKRGVRLTHGYRYAKDVKIGHLPCVYIRIDCRGSGSHASI